MSSLTAVPAGQTGFDVWMAPSPYLCFPEITEPVFHLIYDKHFLEIHTGILADQ